MGIIPKFFLTLFAGVILTLPAYSYVGLYASNVGPLTPTVPQGGTLTLDVSVGFDSGSLIGVDFDFYGDVPLMVTSQTLTGPLSDPNTLDATAIGADLGGTLNLVTQPLAPGIYPVGRYTLTVGASASLGLHTVSVAPIAMGAGWVDGGFNDRAFDSLGAVNFNVVSVPEPSRLAVYVLVGSVLLLRIRR